MKLIRSLHIISFTLFFLLVAATPTRPAWTMMNIEEQVASCAQIIDRISRLLCYDEMAKNLGYIPADEHGREESILETYGFWEVTKRRNAAGEEIIYLKNDSVEEVISKSGLQRNPTLVIKCKAGQTDVYLDWKTRLIPRNVGGVQTMPITLQFNSNPRKVAYWELSTDRNAIFAPDPVEFVKTMRQSDRLVMHITPSHDIAHTIVHDISGLNVVLELLVQQCYN